MKKNIVVSIIIALFIGISIFGAYYFLSIYNSSQTTHESKKSETEVIDSKGKKIDAEDVQQKISTLKKRLSLKGLIQDGDIHFQNKEYTRALAKYIQVNRQNPNDQSIINKMGNIYYNINKYEKAYTQYTKILDYSKLDVHKSIQTLFYVIFNKPDSQYTIENIQNFNLSETEKFYYSNSYLCHTDINKCIVQFEQYFKNRDLENITGTGEIHITDGIIFPELENIGTALTNYQNFQLDDNSYKQALIVGVFFQNKLYPTAIEMSQQILSHSPDYRPIIQIIAKSHYEMGNYIDAKKSLIQYNGLGDSEPEIYYFLGIIHQKLREYTRSIIQLRQAEKLGYTNTIDIQRRLIFNYHQLDDPNKMLKIFEEMISENLDTMTHEDMNLAIFYFILNEKYAQVKNYISIAKAKFPESEVYYAYQGWLMLQNENINNEVLEAAEKVLEKGLAINPKNPMISLTLGQIEEIRKNNQKAFIYYKQTISLDQGGEYEKLAKVMLDNLQSKLESDE